MNPSMLFSVPSCITVLLVHIGYTLFNSMALPRKFSLYRLALASWTPRTHFRTIVESDTPLGILVCFAA